MAVRTLHNSYDILDQMISEKVIITAKTTVEEFKKMEVDINKSSLESKRFVAIDPKFAPLELFYRIALNQSAKSGNLEIIDYCSEKYPAELKMYLQMLQVNEHSLSPNDKLAESNNLSQEDMFLRFLTNVYVNGSKIASENNERKAIKKFVVLLKDKVDYNEIILGAMRGGNFDLAEEFEEIAIKVGKKEKIQYHWFLKYIARHGNLIIYKKYETKAGSYDVTEDIDLCESVLNYAFKSENRNMIMHVMPTYVKKASEQKRKNWQVLHAASQGQFIVQNAIMHLDSTEIIKYLFDNLDKSTIKIEECFDLACSLERENVIRYFIDNKLCDFDKRIKDLKKKKSLTWDDPDNSHFIEKLVSLKQTLGY